MRPVEYRLGLLFPRSDVGSAWSCCSCQKLTAGDGSTSDCFVPLLFIPRLLIETQDGHERMSEIGKRMTTAECRLVGLFSRKDAVPLAPNGGHSLASRAKGQSSRSRSLGPARPGRSAAGPLQRGRPLRSADPRVAQSRRDSRRLATIPGIGPITASALSAAVPDASLFRSGWQFAAWLGFTPRANSSSGEERLGWITRQGDCDLRQLLVVGATVVIRMARKDAARRTWLAQLLERKPAKIATVALADKTARIAWAGRSRNEVYPASAA